MSYVNADEVLPEDLIREIQKYVDIEMETIITSFISLLLELIHIVIHYLMFHYKS
mgnify:FL=1